MTETWEGASLLTRIGNAVWGWPLMILFLGVGLLFTIRLRGIQWRYLGRALRSIFQDDGGKGDASPYAALCTALAATIGTGNIVGVATALCIGGPGALLWMLIAAVFGMATQYAEGFLAVKYRRKSGGRWHGGPFYYIEYGLGKRFRWLAVSFAGIGALVGLLGVGTVTQVNSITSSVENFFDVQRAHIAFSLAGRGYSWAVVISGVLVAFFSALVLIGGVKRIMKVCETLVPLMSAAYVLCCVLILVLCAGKIPAALRLIGTSAFAPRAALGAGAGISLRMAMRMGIGRGVLTNEAGVGSTPIAAAAARTNDPVRQGLVTMTGTFIDTIVICSMTGLCLVLTGAWNMPGLEGVQVTDYAWRTTLPWAQSLSSFVLMLCLVFFAFATIIGWNFYAESCLAYLVKDNRRAVKIYRALYIVAIIGGPYLTVSAAWEMADIFNALMALPNLTALLLLHKTVVRDTQYYLRRTRGK
ncbi:MAG: sodium:alanine symporter family protein [Oscillospiraceae bacterium]|nr:sodium:alanine symporter family protein [Oscillospiraceae bacterium]